MKVRLKLKRPHPLKRMAFGRFSITNEFQICELDEKEVKELSNPGPQHWFEIEVEVKKAKTRRAKAQVGKPVKEVKE